jgi:hypothetical protein
MIVLKDETESNTGAEVAHWGIQIHAAVLERQSHKEVMMTAFLAVAHSSQVST